MLTIYTKHPGGNLVHKKGELYFKPAKASKLKYGVEPGVPTIYTNHPGGNLGHKYKTIKFDETEERPATTYVKDN